MDREVLESCCILIGYLCLVVGPKEVVILLEITAGISHTIYRWFTYDPLANSLATKWSIFVDELACRI